MIIREATKEDFPVLAGMIEVHPEPSYDCSCSFYQATVFRMVGCNGVKIWIAYKDNRAVGYLIGMLDTSGLFNQVYVFDIYVSESDRDGSVSKGLLNIGKEWASSIGVKRVVWSSKISARAWGRLTGNSVEEIHYCSMEV